MFLGNVEKFRLKWSCSRLAIIALESRQIDEIPYVNCDL